jgi:energy-coupling factor transporter ATP-binding protein EcfA2
LAVPIIAGVAARYDAARDPDVPRIVFLDEVFAGFDPQNRETYLRYLNELNLNWMITCPEDMPYSSQMPAVMSYQLHLSGTVHTAYPTLWDGRKVTDPSELVGMVMLRDVAGRKQEVGT